MNAKEGLNLLDFLPTGIDKSDPVIQAVFSDDEGEGAIANEIEGLLTFIRYYSMTNNVREHYGYSLEMICRLFTKTIRQLEEDDRRLLRRMLALTVRGGDAVWGNGTDIEHVFEAYFSSIKAYLCENTNEASILDDGDFENNSWNLTGGAGYTGDARFSGTRGLFFDGTPGSCSQTVSHVEPGVYALHFFLLGRCGVKIRCSDGRYWNGVAEPDRYLLRWETSEVINRFQTAAWKDVFCFIVPPDTDDTLTVEFVSLDGAEASVDYVRLFQKPLNPSYTIVVQYGGFKVSDKTLHLGAGVTDPIAGVDYRKESYFDHSYIVGRQGAYQEEVYDSVLDIIRPRGIQAFIEFVEKTELETA